MVHAGTLSKAFSLFDRLSSLLAFGSESTAVGLSIGTSSVKIAELKKSGKTWTLMNFGMIQLPEEAIVNREIINSIAVADHIHTLTNQVNLKSKTVCTSLSGPSVVVKRMTVEVSNPKDLQDQVFWEAEQYVPFDPSDVVMDYHLISKPRETKAEVVLVAVKKTALSSYMTAVGDAGLRPKWVDIDLFALQNVFEANYPVNPSESVALVDIGASSIKMVVVYGGVPIFTKDSAIGGQNLTSEIQKHLKLSFADAESLKTSGGAQGSLPQEVNGLMKIMSDTFAAEIKKALDFCSASSAGPPVSYVLLSGGSSRLPGLSKVVEDTIGIPTQLMNPLNSISYDSTVLTPEYIASIAPIASIPIGLALRAGEK